MRFNVVLATHKRSDLLGRTLDSLAQASRPDGFERVIVIENGPPAGAAEICRTASKQLPIDYHHLPQAGKSRALQHGLDIVQEGFVLFLDDDVRISTDLLQAYAAAVQQHGADAVYGGPLLVDYEKVPPEWLIPYLPYSAKGWENDPGFPWFLGANYGVFAERALATGGMDFRLGVGALHPGATHHPVGEEVSLQRQLLGAGCKRVYIPEAKVWHYVPAESCTPTWTLHRCYRNAMTDAIESGAGYSGPHWFGVPRWLWRSLATASLRAIMARSVREEQRRFEMQLDFYKIRGSIQGSRLASAR